MHIRFDDHVRKFEEFELKFHIRNIFASDKIGELKEVQVSLREPAVHALPSRDHSTKDSAEQSEWLIEIPPRRTGEFVCSRIR